MQQNNPPTLNTSIPISVMVLFVVAIAARLSCKALDTASAASKSQIAWRKPEFVEGYDKSAQKLLLFDFTAQWCGPCKRMDKTTFLNRRITEIIGREFEAVRVIDREQEDGKNNSLVDELQKDYSVYGFPTVVVALPDRTTVSWRSGYLDPKDMASFLEKARNSAPFVQAMVLASKENYKEAAKYLKDVNDVNWKGYEAREKAMIYWHVYKSLGQDSKAIDAVNAADRTAATYKGDKPEDMPHPLYKYMRGELSAEQLLEKCERKYNEADARCALALSELRAGNRQQAVKEFVKSIRLNSYGTNKLAHKFLDHLEPQKRKKRHGRADGFDYFD